MMVKLFYNENNINNWKTSFACGFFWGWEAVNDKLKIKQMKVLHLNCISSSLAFSVNLHFQFIYIFAERNLFELKAYLT